MGSVTPSFDIPPEFQTQLTVVLPRDERSDKEILESLKKFKPVTSEKNIWAFWHSGIKGLPAWCKRNVVDWFRINGPSWSIRVLDSDPGSPNFFLNYVSKDVFPDSVASGTMTGHFTGQHTADFVRTATIYIHGGVFMDVGCIQIRRMDRTCWDKLTNDQSPYKIGIASMFAPNLANHFVACRKRDPFIRRWIELMLYAWKDKTEATGTILGNPLVSSCFEHFQANSSEPLDKLGWDFIDLAETTEYIGQILFWMRLCFLDKEDGEGFNPAQYWAKHVLVWDVLREHWQAELLLHRTGPHPRMLQLLAMRTDANPETEDYKAAYDLTWKLLTSSCMQKVTSARNLTKTPHLGVLWEQPENLGKDCAPGTFAELLRYGSVHFEQTRKEISYITAKPVEHPMNKDLLEV